MLHPAPLFKSFSPPNGLAFWAFAGDGVRLRMAHWQGTGRGTMFLLPGRTEYIEKYYDGVQNITAMGFDCITIDWRGQGLSDRLIQNRKLGHVDDFQSYQLDVAAMLAAADTLNLPQPFYLLAHSMGGCIGLRRLLVAPPFEKAVFSGPMWGINLPIDKYILAHTVLRALSKTTFSTRIVPTGEEGTYPQTADFTENMLTNDRDMYNAMCQQIFDNPDLAVGSPTIGWMGAALREMGAVMRAPAPALPALTFLGSDEAIVSPACIHEKMREWKNGTLQIKEGARHEIMMESAALRDNFYTEVDRFFV